MALRGLRYGRRFAESLAGATRLPLLRTGLHQGLFEALRAPQTPESLAERLALAPDLVLGFLRAAHAHGLLRRRSGRYTLTGFVRWLLDAPEAAALHAMLDQTALAHVPRFEELPALLKGAERPMHGAPEEALRIAAATRLLERGALRALQRIRGLRKARRILDIGCGQGAYLVGLLSRYRDAQALGVEQEPEVAEAARRNLREAEVWRRAEVLVGDFMALELPRGSYHLALLNHSLHYFPPTERNALFQRVHERLAEDGVLAVQTAVVPDSALARSLGFAAPLASRDLYLRSHRDLHGLPDREEIAANLRDAGFAEVGEVAIGPGGPACYVFGRRAGTSLGV